MQPSEILDCSIDKLKGMFVVLASMSDSSSRGSSYTNMADALRLLADQVYDIATDLENMRDGKDTEK